MSQLLRRLLLGAMLAFPAWLCAQQETRNDTSAAFEPLVTSSGNILAASDIPVRMRDGTLISVDIYRPLDNDSHPTLYAAGPFPHTLDILEDKKSTAGPVAWYVSQGYAVVVANVRGTGLSQGEFSFFARAEQQDHYEVIEWIAEQPWSDGQVAGTGAGYYAASQWQMAIQNPPHLECIAPVNGALDPYREWVSPGGLANTIFINDWYDRKVRLANAYAKDAARLVTFDMRLAQLSHPYYDEFWKIRSSLDSVTLISVPVLALNDWNLDQTEAGLGETYAALSRLNVINKILIRNPSGQVPLYQDTGFLARELLPYYQWCFNGRELDSTFIETPRIRYQVRGQNTVKPESAWPPGNIAQQGWFLNSVADNNGLVYSLDPQQQTGNPGFSSWNRGDDAMVSFVSAPLAQAMEISGPLMLELYISSTLEDMAVEVTVEEELVYRSLPATPPLSSFLSPETEQEQEAVSEGSTRIMVSRGALKASSRALDPDRSSDYLPVYTLENNQTLAPGQVYRLDIALRQTAYRLSAGSRLVLNIRPVDDGSLAQMQGRDMLQYSSQYPSRLWLPVVQNSRAASQGPVDLSPPNNAIDIDGPVPEFDFLSPEALDELNGNVENPVIFVPR